MYLAVGLITLATLCQLLPSSSSEKSGTFKFLGHNFGYLLGITTTMYFTWFLFNSKQSAKALMCYRKFKVIRYYRQMILLDRKYV